MKNLKHTRLLSVLLASVATLAGCGHDNSKTTVSYLLKHPDKIQSQQNWCGQQPHPSMIYGCRAIANAKLIQKDPKLVSQIGKSSPITNGTFQSITGSWLAGDASYAQNRAAKTTHNQLSYYQELARATADRKLMGQYPAHPYSGPQITALIYWCLAQSRFQNLPLGHLINNPMCQVLPRAREILRAGDVAAARAHMPYPVVHLPNPARFIIK